MAPMELICDYVMFGSSESKANHMTITSKAIQISHRSEDEIKYSVLIDFKNIVELKICRHYSMSGICLKIDRQTIDEITDQLLLQNESINRFKFDTNSSDVSDHYIIAILTDQMSADVSHHLIINSLINYKHMTCVQISAEDLKNMLRKILNRINNTLVMITNEWTVSSSTGCNDRAVDYECDSTAEEVTTSSLAMDFIGVQEFICVKPIDVFFGTFVVIAQQIEIYSNGIQLIDIEEDMLMKWSSKLKNHLLIPFANVITITYKLHNSLATLMIRTTDSFSRDVDRFLRIKNDDQNRHYGSSSLDMRHRFLFIRFRVNCSKSFVKFLRNIQIMNANLSLEECADGSSDRIHESTKSLIKDIFNENRIKELQNKLSATESEFNVLKTEIIVLKQKCNELEENELFCAICLERKTQIVAKTQIVSTVCGHIFCNNCLKRSLEVRNVCPVCIRTFQKPRKVSNLPFYHQIHF